MRATYGLLCVCLLVPYRWCGCLIWMGERRSTIWSCENSDNDYDHDGYDYESPRSARVPRLAALLASLRCLCRRGSPSAPAPFSPTYCRPLQRQRQRPLHYCYHYRYRDR
jgi:hypothetical protein